MNKYSSKAIKTAATVGMSLAMVLSNVAPVMPIMAASIDDVVDQKNNIIDLLDLLGDVKTISAKTTISGSKDLVNKINGNSDLSADLDFGGLLTNAGLVDALQSALRYASITGYTDEQEDTLKYLVGTKITGVNGGNAQNAVAHAASLLTMQTDLENYNGTVDSTVVALYNKVSALLDFKGNIDNTSANIETLDKIEDLFADLESDVKDYKEDTVEADAKKFANALAKEVVAGKTVGALVDDEAEIAYTYQSTIKAFISKITKDSYKLDVDSKGTMVKYGDVKNEGVVADYIEGLETIVSEMQDVKDLLNDTKSEKKAFDKLSTLIGDLVKVIKTDANDTQWEAIDDEIVKFRAADVKVLKEYVETVVNEFWTVTTEQRSSGSYRVKEVDAGLGRYYTLENVAGKNLKALMTTLVDSDEEETFYDLLVADAASTDELLKAVTSDIEGITLNSTMTNKQAAKIIAAKKALSKLDANKQAIYNTLKRSEKADVDANRELIDALYFKLILNGNVTASGWVDKGNGEWDYIAEDGSRPTKWVASGANWYYVKNGTMLRNSWIASDAQGTRWYYVDDAGVMVSNTTVNGYTFNSYGVWVK